MKRIIFVGFAFAFCFWGIWENSSFAISPEDEQWVDATIRGMTLEEKAGQLLDLPLDARKIGDEDYMQERIKEVKEYHIGSYMFLMIPGDMYEIARGIQRLQEASRIPLIVGTNSEGGAGGFVKQAVRFPNQMAMGAAGDADLVYQAGRIMALESKALGADMACIPNGSLNNNPDNPVINVRAYSDNPQLAARMAVAYIRGLQDHGFPAQIGLFPGHGDTDIDSHQSLPTLNVHSRERLFTVELVPFIAAFDAGCSSLMTSHVIIPFVDPENPATLSKAIMTDILRKGLRFDGLVYTDAIRMGAIMEHYGVGESAVLAIEAGCDVIVWPSDFREIIRAITAAVQSGRISEDRLNESLRRRLRVKVMGGVHRYKPQPIENLEMKIGLPEYRDAAQRIAEKAVTIAKDQAALIPVNNQNNSVFLMFNGNQDAAKEINNAFPNCPVMNIAEKKEGEALEIDPDPMRISPAERQRSATSEQSQQEILNVVRGKQDIFIAAFLGRGTKISEEGGYYSVVKELLTLGKRVCIISFGDPYIYRFFPAVHAYVCAYGADNFARNAALKVLKGEMSAQGRLPIRIPGLESE